MSFEKETLYSINKMNLHLYSVSVYNILVYLVLEYFLLGKIIERSPYQALITTFSHNTFSILFYFKRYTKYIVQLLIVLLYTVKSV